MSMSFGEQSLASSIASLPKAEREKIIRGLSQDEVEALLYDWQFWARPNQIIPAGLWRIWLILAGRGWGKTRTGAEATRAVVESGKYGRIALVAATAADVRDVMVEGESGILAISPPWNRPEYEPSKRRLTWPNGAIATTYSADEPDRLRGPQHDFAWADELAAWRHAEAWDMLLMGLRLGPDPRAVTTTTPKPIPIIKNLLTDPTVVATRGSTYENKANLAQAFMDEIISRYEGTRLGRQELYAELLEDNPDALWRRELIDASRVRQHPQLVLVVVGVDPEATSTKDSAETGIIVAGRGIDGQGYVLDDLSVRATPDKWASAAVTGYHKHQANRIIGEANQGGEMVSYTIKTVDAKVPVKLVHATRGKFTRAEPISALYEQGKVHHVGTFGILEDQMTEWVPGDKSPDRLDALVWALSELMTAPSAKLDSAPADADKYQRDFAGIRDKSF